MVMTRKPWIPDPIPTPDGMDELGYLAWIWAAGYRPRWLATLANPHQHFQELGDQINTEMDKQACDLVGIQTPPAPPVGEHTTPEWDAFETALVTAEADVMAALAFQRPEVTTPVWVEGVVDTFDPDGMDVDSMGRWWQRVQDSETLDQVADMVQDLDPSQATQMLAQRWPDVDSIDNPE